MEPGSRRSGEPVDEGGCGRSDSRILKHFSQGKSVPNWSLAPGSQLRRWLRAAAGGHMADFWALFLGEKWTNLEPGFWRWGEALDGNRSSSGCRRECVPKEECLCVGRGCQVRGHGAWFFFKVPSSTKGLGGSVYPRRSA